MDSSVTLTWFLPDEESELRILDKTIKEGAIVPTVWGLEIGNVLLCAERAKRLTANQRHQVIYTLKGMHIKIDHLPFEYTLFDIMDLAIQYNLTFYDASYLEVALRHNLPIATLDKALRKASKEAGIIII
ncbi:MAG: type II toxin-antitoxin system VapC family toxin [Rickettsia endosymbiont of Pentastiridius leporinus]